MRRETIAVVMCTGLLLWVGVWPVGAATPLDGLFVNILGSLPLWGQGLVGLGGIILAVGGLYMLHAGPMVLMGIIIGFGVLLVIAASTSGQLFNWLTSIGV